MQLYKLKSNPKTIVEIISEDLVRAIWSSETYNSPGFIYKIPRDSDNLIPLNESECKEVIAQRTSTGFCDEIGLL